MKNFTGKVYVCTRVGSRITVKTVLRDDNISTTGFQFCEETQGDGAPKFVQCDLPMTNKKTAHCKICVGEFIGITFDFVVNNKLATLLVPAQLVAFSNIHDLAIFMDSVH
jgi:hypothetical protein